MKKFDKQKERITQSIVAYECIIKYRERNNPLKIELKEEIKNKMLPEYSFDKLINDFYQHFILNKTALHDDFSNKVVYVEKGIQITELEFGIKRYYLSVFAGRKGENFDVINNSDIMDKQHFGEGQSASYPHHVIFYLFPNGKIIGVFHHNGVFSCKSALQSVLNEKILKDKGLYFKMNVLDCNEINANNIDDIKLDKVVLQRECEIISSDKADSLKKPKIKKIVDYEIQINLASNTNFNIAKVTKDFLIKVGTKIGVINSVVTKLGLDESGDYGGKIIANIGGRKKVVDFEKFQGLIGEYYITDLLEYIDDKPTLNSLIKICDTHILKLFK